MWYFGEAYGYILPFQKSLLEAKLKRFELIALMKEVSQELS